MKGSGILGTRLLQACIVLLWLGSAASAAPGDIHTYAGNGGNNGLLGDGGPATSAGLYLPISLSLDGAGNIYVSENHRIREATASDGKIKTLTGIGVPGFVGDGNYAVFGRISRPMGIEVDAAGNIYFIDADNYRIRKIDAATNYLSTFAGNGAVGAGGDGGPANKASFINPRGLISDAAGNLYISDYTNHKIRKIDIATGIIQTIAGTGAAGFGGDGGPATAALLKNPWGIAFDADENLYIADQGNNRIRKINAATGVISSVAGAGYYGNGGDGGSAIAAGLNQPSGVAVDAAGNIYIADTVNNRIRRVRASDGVINTVAGTGQRGYAGDGGGALSAQLNWPTTLDIGPNGNLYIADWQNHRIRMLNPATGVISTVVGSSTISWPGDGGAAADAGLYRPQDVALDKAENMFIPSNDRLRKVSAVTRQIFTQAGVGSKGFSGDTGLAIYGRLNDPIAAAVDALGNVYIADATNGRVRKVDGQYFRIYTVAGNGAAAVNNIGGLATSAGIGNVRGVAVDGKQNIYISSFNGNQVFKVSATTGVITAYAGTGQKGYSGNGGPAAQAQLSTPWGLAVDRRNNLYIADFGNSVVRKVDAETGIISLVAGNQGEDYNGEDLPATEAYLNQPADIDVDLAFNVYIASTLDHRVRRVDAKTGLIRTIAGTGAPGYSGEDGPAELAQLNLPTGVAVGRFNRIFIADTANNRIRVVEGDDPSVIPTLGEWGIILLVTAMFAVGTWQLSRRGRFASA